MRIHLDVLDPDPYWECGSGSMEIDQNLQINLVFCLSKRLLCLHFICMFIDLLPNLSIHIFHVKMQLFVIQKSDQDQDSDPPGSAMVWIPGSGSALCKKLDPDPHLNPQHCKKALILTRSY